MKTVINVKSYCCRDSIILEGHNCMMKTYIIFIMTFLFLSCSSLSFAKDKREYEANRARKTCIGEEIVDSDPKQGDIKIVDGIEYIYASNRKYMFTAFEPEYKWERKDQYTPRIGENLLSDNVSEKERKALEARISKLEEALKAQQTAKDEHPVNAVDRPGEQKQTD